MAIFTLNNIPKNCAIDTYRAQVAAGAAKLRNDLDRILQGLPDDQKPKIKNVIDKITLIEASLDAVKLRLTTKRNWKHFEKTTLEADYLMKSTEVDSIAALLKDALKHLRATSKCPEVKEAHLLIENARSEHEALRERKCAEFLFEARKSAAQPLLRMISSASTKDHDVREGLYKQVYRLNNKNRYNLNTSDKISKYYSDIKKLEKESIKLFGSNDSQAVDKIKQFTTIAASWSDQYQQDIFTSNLYFGGKIRLSEDVVSNAELDKYRYSAKELMRKINVDLNAILGQEIKHKKITVKTRALIKMAIQTTQLNTFDFKLRPTWLRVGSTDLVANGLHEAHGSDPAERAIMDAYESLPRRTFDPYIKAAKKKLREQLAAHEALRREQSDAFLFEAKSLSAKKIIRQLDALKENNIGKCSFLKSRVKSIIDADENTVDRRRNALKFHEEIVGLSRDLVDFFNESDKDNVEKNANNVAEFSILSKRWVDPYYHDPIVRTLSDKMRETTGTVTTVVGTVFTVLGFVSLFVPVFGPIAATVFFALSFVSLYSVADRLFEMGRNIWHGRSVTVEQVKNMGFTAFISVGCGMAIGQVLAQIGVVLSTGSSIALHRAGAALAKGAASFIGAVKMCFFSVQAVFQSLFQRKQKAKSPQIDPMLEPSSARVAVPAQAIIAPVSKKTVFKRRKRPSSPITRIKAAHFGRQSMFATPKISRRVRIAHRKVQEHSPSFIRAKIPTKS